MFFVEILDWDTIKKLPGIVLLHVPQTCACALGFLHVYEESWALGLNHAMARRGFSCATLQRFCNIAPKACDGTMVLHLDPKVIDGTRYNGFASCIAY